MWYTHRKIALLLFMVIIAAASQAQNDAQAAIHKIYSSYSGGKAVHFTGSMKMYIKNNPLKIIDRIQSSYTVKNKNFSCHIGPVSMLLNDSYYVSVDNSDKLIMIGRKKDLSELASAPALNLDQIKKWIDEKKVTANTDNRGATSVLQLTDAGGTSGFNEYSIEYSTADGYMKKVVLEINNYNNEAGKIMVLEIIYSEPQITEDRTALFSEKTFFSIVNNKIQLTDAYKNYQVINQL